MISIFFVSHWTLSVLLQSLFQHRYAAHRMFSMSPRAERAMHLMTAVVQGSSYLEPRAYAILHREHHAFADTEHDPHSPAFHRNIFRMMWETARRYAGYVTRRKEPEPRFLGGYPEWAIVDRAFSGWPARVGFGALYTLFYHRFAQHRWQWALLPLHFVMGPVHGAIVNWCGHRYGYRNFASRDQSRNTLPIDVVCLGELFQNNHHARPASPDFAARGFELDPTWQVMRLLARLKIIRVAHAPSVRAEPPADVDFTPRTPVIPSMESL
jgi:stearoyl-CoA desaturase (delta-9 desaturase)